MAMIIGAPTPDDALAALAHCVKRCEERGEQNLVFCEDSLTLLAERAVLAETGGTFLTEVTTFARFLSGERQVLSKQGSVMALSAILTDCEGELSCFSAGAAETVYETLAQLAASRVDAAQLRAGAEATEGALRAKLTDLALLSERYASFFRKTHCWMRADILRFFPKRSESAWRGSMCFLLRSRLLRVRQRKGSVRRQKTRQTLRVSFLRGRSRCIPTKRRAFFGTSVRRSERRRSSWRRVR